MRKHTNLRPLHVDKVFKVSRLYLNLKERSLKTSLQIELITSIIFSLNFIYEYLIKQFVEFESNASKFKTSF